MVTAKGRDAIADLFCLTGVLGGIYSELSDIAESMSYGTPPRPLAARQQLDPGPRVVRPSSGCGLTCQLSQSQTVTCS